MQDIARRIAKVCSECKLDVSIRIWMISFPLLGYSFQIDETTYVDQFKPFLMDVVHDWCNGASFLSLCKKTDIFEGKLELIS